MALLGQIGSDRDWRPKAGSPQFGHRGTGPLLGRKSKAVIRIWFKIE